METRKINGKEMVGFAIEDRGTTRMVYVLSDTLAELSRKEAAGDAYSFDYRMPCFHENGDRVHGIWKHGRTGEKRYTEPVSFDAKSKNLVSVRDYHSGGIRNSREFLIRVNWN